MVQRLAVSTLTSNNRGSVVTWAQHAVRSRAGVITPAARATTAFFVLFSLARGPGVGGVGGVGGMVRDVRVMRVVEIVWWWDRCRGCGW